MKKYHLIIAVLTLSAFVRSAPGQPTRQHRPSSIQEPNPVHWTFSVKRTDPGVYEVHLTATIDEGWHTYSQTTPAGGPSPTAIHFTASPLITLVGKPNETGRLEQHAEPLFGVDVKQYSNKVDFVQVVKIRGSAKTALAGTIEFMVCNDHECMPPATRNFSVAIK